MEQNERIPNNRIPYLDILRVLACLMVVFTHSAMPSSEEDGIYLAFISLIGSPSSELFLTLSGAILLPIKTDYYSFYKKRFAKLLPPVVIWSIIYVLLLYFKGNIDFASVCERIIKIPFVPIVGVYWFIYVMIGLYLFAPIISPWIRNVTKKELEIFLAIWGVSLLMPYLNIIIPGIYNNDGSYYWTLVNFSGFLGYWILGHYLHKYPIKIGLNRRWVLCTIGLIVYIITLATLKLKGFVMQPYFDNLQIGSAIFVVSIFTIIQSLSIHIGKHKIISKFANYSFGIYLIHIIVIRQFVWLFFETLYINPIIKTSIVTIISFILSAVIIKIISKFPFSKYIVGI